MDGPDGAAFYLSSEQYEDGAMYTMVTIPHASTGTDVACVGLILYSYNSNKDSWSRGKLIYDVPLSKDALNVRTMNTPVSMNGVTVTQVKLSYSPLKTYIMVRYHIDPELGRFERMRREGMSFELMRDGEPIRDYRLWITPTEAEEAEASGDFILRSDLKTTEPYDHLTITLTGRDREVYWKHTVQFKEADE